MVCEINIPRKLIGIGYAALGALLGFYLLPNKAAEKDVETNKLVSDNKELGAQVKRLQDLEADKDSYIADTIAFDNEAEVILKEFPVFMFLEDKILYSEDMVFDRMENYHLEEFAYGQSDYVMSTSYSDDSLMELYRVKCSSEFGGLTYPQLKSLLLYGQSEDNRELAELLEQNQGEEDPEDVKIHRFVLSYLSARFDEETGYIYGEFSYSTYFIAGQRNHVYQFDKDVLAEIGEERRVDDLFGARTDELDELLGEYGDSEDLEDLLNDINNGN